MGAGLQLCDLVRNLPNGTEAIICACNAGESRSAALRAGLCEYFQIDSAWIWDSPEYHPNMLVFDLFTQALGVEIDGVQKDDLFIRNKRAFTDAIKQARGQKA